MKLSRYNFPTRILSGAGAVQELVPALMEAGVRSPLIVTDAGIAKLDLLETLTRPLREAGFSSTIFSEISGNPNESQVNQGINACRKADADAVIGFGGGSAIDVAKVIALASNYQGQVFDFEDGNPNTPKATHKIPFIVGIPTTAGTGSEVGRCSVISDDQTKIKRIIFSPRLVPNLVILDPLFSLGLPPNITATTGIDALSHLVEAYLVRSFNPLCDGIALQGIRLVAENLAKTVEFAAKNSDHSQEHIDARTLMLNASMLGAVAFQKGLGVTHSCAHALSAICNLHHGLAIGVMLPYTMEFNLLGSEERFIEMSSAARLSNCQPQALIDWIVELKREIGIPTFLSEVGVEQHQLEELVALAEKDPLNQENPRTVSPNDLRALFSKAFKPESV